MENYNMQGFKEGSDGGIGSARSCVVCGTIGERAR